MELVLSDALLVIDVQNDFCPNGALAVKDGDTIIQQINAAMDHFNIVVLTQDWHPNSHKSFASSYENKKPFDTVEMFYGNQVLWPDHCIQGSMGARFHPNLNHEKADVIIRKGSNPAVDIYGLDAKIINKHFSCSLPIIDARVKPHHAPVLER